MVRKRDGEMGRRGDAERRRHGKTGTRARGDAGNDRSSGAETRGHGDTGTKRDRETGRWGDAEPSEFMRRSDFHFDRESVLAVSPLFPVSPSLPTRVPGKYFSRIL
jgi:hypothetical protein